MSQILRGRSSILWPTILRRNFHHPSSDPMLESRDNLPIIRVPKFYNGSLKKIRRSIFYENTIAVKKTQKRASPGGEKHARCLSNHVQKRYIQEFPTQRYDNAPPKDYVIVLPEKLNETSDNELLRIPKIGESEVDFSKFTTDSVYRGLSQAISQFEDFVTDMNNNIETPSENFDEFFKAIEKHLFPMDNAYNILMILMNVDSTKYSHKEIYDILNRYMKAREQRNSGIFKYQLQNFVLNSYDKLDAKEKMMLSFYQMYNTTQANMRSIDQSSLSLCRDNLREDMSAFRKNLGYANANFSHTVDDPDILSAVASEFEDCQDLHHKERTPLTITTATYQKFMRLCPDRFVRHMLWQTCNRRCSPKSSPKYNNIIFCKSIRVSRRKIADLCGFRTHAEMRLENSMAKSRSEVLASFKCMNNENGPKLIDRLQELNDFAADNNFEDPSQMGVQEYDVDYWSHRYMHDILIGMSERDLKAFFPLNAVMSGIHKYFSDYFDIKMKVSEGNKPPSWTRGLQYIEVSRRDKPIGTIIFDPFQRDGKTFDLFYGRVRSRNPSFDCLPARYIAAPYKFDSRTQQANLTFTDIVYLFKCYGIVLQRLMYNYKYYELNIHGGLEIDANNLLQNICTGHLFSDHKILQSCSDRGNSKTIDTETANRILKAYAFSKPLKTWHDLYKAHLDFELYTNLSDTKGQADDIYSMYSPFKRDPDNYDFCAMDEVFIGPNEAANYANLWSRQLANFCLTHEPPIDGLSTSQTVESRKGFYTKLIDALLDSSQSNTEEKLTSLCGQRFEASKTGLGML